MTIVIYLTLLLDFNKIVRALGIVTPFLIIMVILIAVYYLFTGDISIAQVNNTVPETSAWKVYSGDLYTEVLLLQLALVQSLLLVAMRLSVEFQVLVRCSVALFIPSYLH